MGRAGDAKSKIEKAALQLFVKRGVAEASIREIAIGAGVFHGAMYYHYPSMDELAWTSFSRNFSEIGVALRTLVHEKNGIKKNFRAMNFSAAAALQSKKRWD
jgi:AcrR family transcriptional regulator